MAILLLAAFIGVPLLEIAVFIEVGDRLGLWNTLAVVILTAFIGTWLLRIQGLATLARVRGQIDQGVLPTSELFDGLCLLFAGALLLTPGFVTDSIGFALFVPQVRSLLRQWLGSRLELSMTGSAKGGNMGRERAQGPGPHGPQRSEWGSREPGDGVIDGEFTDMTDEEHPKDSDSDKNGPTPPTGHLPR
ncbi:FxsA family protein [Pelagibius sp. Alg239-R121]|uniref:FxsA family protein n=1 Tax=Pelagibius sp. Alg239-R121 TaxID=2993448 RepID=UPI0024A74247|nr:FxsA family protein [Pelagibius sp. Alg239-R121]